MERDFKGIWIPKEVWLSTELSIQEKILLCEIDSLDNEQGCYASNGYFADFFQLSKTRISQIINDLQAKGYLTIELIYKEGTKEIDRRIIHVTTPLRNLSTGDGGVKNIKRGIENIKGGIENIKHTPLRNCKANNTTINNTNNINTSKDRPTANAVGLAPSKKQNSSEGLFSAGEDKKKKKAREIKTMEGMTNVFSDNPLVRQALMDYFKIRLKKGLQPEQWKIILDDVKRVCGNDEELIIEKTRGAIAANYMQIIASWEKPVAQKRSRSTFDNTAGRATQALANMTREEQEAFERSLPRDEKGNLLKF